MPAVSPKSPSRRAARALKATRKRGGAVAPLARLLAAATAGKPDASRKMLAALSRLASVSTCPDLVARAAALGAIHRTALRASQGATEASRHEAGLVAFASAVRRRGLAAVYAEARAAAHADGLAAPTLADAAEMAEQGERLAVLTGRRIA